MPSDNSERRNFDCKVTRKTPEGAWDLTGRNAHLIWGVNMGASVIWYDCVTTSGQSSVNNLTDESLEKTQTSDDCEANVITFTDTEDNRRRSYMFTNSEQAQQLFDLLKNKDASED